MIPEQTNRLLLYADRPGRYRGQCAEFCGLQHAHMGMYVFADPPAAFRAWLARAVGAGAGGGLGVSSSTSAAAATRSAARRRRVASGPT